MELISRAFALYSGISLNSHGMTGTYVIIFINYSVAEFLPLFNQECALVPQLPTCCTFYYRNYPEPPHTFAKPHDICTLSALCLALLLHS